MVYLDAKHYTFHEKAYLRDGQPVTPEYDFVVVGGGPSGCALATRLSHMKARVLLLEQGTSLVKVVLINILLQPLIRGFRLERYPELQNSAALPLQARSLHGSSFDAAYPVSLKDQFGTSKVMLNSGAYAAIAWNSS